MRVYVRNTTRKHRLNLRGLSRTARDVLDAAGEPRATVSLSFVGDAAIRRLNRDYRGKDRATDVLSFSVAGALNGRKHNESGVPERMLGDIVISVDAAQRQADGYRASLDAELRRLLIHGVLHLLGHDHEQPAEAARMRAQERRLAAAIGLPWPY